MVRDIGCAIRDEGEGKGVRENEGRMKDKGDEG